MLPLRSAIDLAGDVLEGRVKISVCDLSIGRNPDYNINHVEPVGKSTASPSIVSLAQLIKTRQYQVPIAMKMWVDPSGMEPARRRADNYQSHAGGLEYEARMYEKITREIILPKYSPNFIAFITYGCCDLPMTLKQLDLRRSNMNLKLTDSITELAPSSRVSRGQSQAGSRDKVCILVTEKAGNPNTFLEKPTLVRITTVGDYISRSKGELPKEIYLQIIQAIRIMNDKRINHNDLHADNILLAEFDREIVMTFRTSVLVAVKNGERKTYQRQPRNFAIRTKYVPYIYDWDHGYTKDLGDNPKLARYSPVIGDSVFRPHVDLYTVVCQTKLWNTNMFKHIFDSKAIRAINTGATSLLTPLQLQQLERISPVTEDGYFRLYQMSPAMIKQFGLDRWFDNLNNLKYAFVTVIGSQARLHYPQPCRLNIEESVYQMAVHVLGYGFKEFEISDEKVQKHGYNTWNYYLYDPEGQEMFIPKGLRQSQLDGDTIALRTKPKEGQMNRRDSQLDDVTISDRLKKKW